MQELSIKSDTQQCSSMLFMYGPGHNFTAKEDSTRKLN